MNLRECYEQIGGDYDDIMQRLPGEALISRFLKKYAASDEYNKMIAAWDERDYTTLFEVTHNLKGMSANVGLTRINRTVSEICEAVRHGEPQIDLAQLIAEAKEEQAVLLEAVDKLEQ